MKQVLAFVLAIFAGSAFAQTPTCFPFINGVHIGIPRHISTDLGEHVYWACSPRGGEPKVWGFSCLRSECSTRVLAAVQAAIISASAKVSTAQQQYEASVGFNCPDVAAEDSPRGALCRERERIALAFGATWWGAK